MYAFKYQRVDSIANAVAALEREPDAKLLAGGQSLIASMKLRLNRPAEMVDLGSVSALSGVDLINAERSSAVRVGAMTRHADVARSELVKQWAPAVADLAGMIGDRMVREMGTIGGSIANNDPAADYPAAVLGLGATIVTDRRRIAGDLFFRGLYETALEPSEMIVAVEFPIGAKAGYSKFRNPASRFATVGVMVSQTGQETRLAVTGAGPCVFRVPEMERALAADFRPEAIARLKVSAEGLNNDMHASPEYRAHLVTVVAQRAVAAASGRCQFSGVN